MTGNVGASPGSNSIAQNIGLTIYRGRLGMSGPKRSFQRKFTTAAGHRKMPTAYLNDVPASGQSGLAPKYTGSTQGGAKWFATKPTAKRDRVTPVFCRWLAAPGFGAHSRRAIKLYQYSVLCRLLFSCPHLSICLCPWRGTLMCGVALACQCLKEPLFVLSPAAASGTHVSENQTAECKRIERGSVAAAGCVV